MEVRQERCTAPNDRALETVREWTLWLTEVERHMLPRFPRAKPGAALGPISAACSAPWSAKMAGNWPK